MSEKKLEYPSAALYQRLQAHAQKGSYPFHMPGHKGGRVGVFSEWLSMDITEIEGFDNLHQPEGILAEAQRKLAYTFGAEESFFLVNGSTGGILAALLSVLKPGAPVLVARNCHRSVYSGLMLSGAYPVFLQPKVVHPYGICGAITLDTVQQALQKVPDACAIVVTSPTYEGLISNIGGISALAQEKGIPLIVDEAHGAHMRFHTLFPKTALEEGADIVIQSLHKTLPSPTQTAVLHVQGDLIDRIRLRQALAMLQSSSPSYLFLGAMDACRAWLDEQGKQAFAEYTERLCAVREELCKLTQIHLMDEDMCAQAGAIGLDIGKLVLLPKHGTGIALSEYLRKQHAIYLEMASISHAIAMTSPADTQEGYERLLFGLHCSEEGFSSREEKCIPNIEWPPIGTLYYTPREAFYALSKRVELQEAVGEIAGEFYIPYPPGIPVLIPGEEITREAIETLLLLQKNGIAIVGCSDTTLEKVAVLQKKCVI